MPIVGAAMAIDGTSEPTRFSMLAFTIRLVAIIVLPLGFVGVGLWWFVANAQIDQALDQRAVTVSRSLEVSLDPYLGTGVDGDAMVFNPAAVDLAIDTFLRPVLGGDPDVRVVGLDGRLLYSTDPTEVGDQFGLDQLDSGVLRGLAVGEVTADADGRTSVAYSVPVASGGVTVAAALIDVSDDRIIAGVVGRSRSLAYLFGGSALALAIALIPLCWWSLGEVRRQFHKTRIMAMFDNLTGLANRAQFHQRLDEALAGADRGGSFVGLIMLDLDGFKAINDRGGHAAGDRLLKRVSAALDEATRRQETPCRLGGDEFAVIAPRITDREELRSLADRLHKELDMVVPFSDGRTLRVTASLGLALYPEDADAAETLVSVADHAMYKVKASRKAKLPKISRMAPAR